MKISTEMKDELKKCKKGGGGTECENWKIEIGMNKYVGKKKEKSLFCLMNNVDFHSVENDNVDFYWINVILTSESFRPY